MDHNVELSVTGANIRPLPPWVVKLTSWREGSVRDKVGVRGYFAQGLQAYPTLRFEFICRYPGVRSCVLEYRSVNGQTLRVFSLDHMNARARWN